MCLASAQIDKARTIVRGQVQAKRQAREMIMDQRLKEGRGWASNQSRCPLDDDDSLDEEFLADIYEEGWNDCRKYMEELKVR